MYSWKKNVFSKWKYHRKVCPHDLINCGHVRIRSIIHYSKVYDNGIYEQLQTKLDPDSSLTIGHGSHQNCVSTNKSTLHFAVHIDAGDMNHLPPKREQHLGVHKFNFK